MGYRFNGRYDHQLDAKRRIRIPAKLKAKLGDNYSITIGYDGCLWVLPEDSAEDLMDKACAREADNPKARAAKRIILEQMSSPEEDPQGRFVLSKNLIGYAKIEKDVVFIGQGDYIELWSAERYEEYKASFADIDLSQFINF